MTSAVNMSLTLLVTERGTLTGMVPSMGELADGTMRQRTVLLVRSDDIGWTELRVALDAIIDVRVVGDADSLERVYGAFDADPDIVLTAAHPPDHRHAWLPLEVRARFPSSRIVVLAAHFTPDDIAASADGDYFGYLLWSDLSPSKLDCWLATVLYSDLVVASRAIVSTFVEMHRQAPRPVPHGLPLSPCEHDVLRRLAEGMTREQIAAAVHLSRRQVDRIVARLQDKFDATSPFPLVVKATQLRLVP